MKIRLLIASLLMFSLLLSGCGAASGAASGVPSGTASGAASGGDLMVKVHAAERPANPAEPDRAFVDSVGAFSWAVFREAAKEKRNVIMSPASLYLALAMTMNGAGKTTRDAMLKGLSAGSMSMESLNASCRDWRTLLSNTGEKTKLRIGNSIWYNKGFDVDPAFLQTNADFHAADLRQLDFGNGGSAKVINDWVSRATDGEIKEIMDRTDKGEAMYLINAVFFRSLWQDQFPSLKTGPGEFFLESSTISVNFMNREGEMAVLSSDGQQGVLLPFNDKRFSFVAILPPREKTVRESLGGMDADAFQRLLKSSNKAIRKLYLPKFKIEYETGLIDILTRIGLGEAFSGKADFSLMTKSRNTALCITGVKQKAYFKLDENGAEAAAATSITMAGIMKKPEDDSKLIFNRPFLYGIVDTVTGLPLFLGIMDNPAA